MIYIAQNIESEIIDCKYQLEKSIGSFKNYIK